MINPYAKQATPSKESIALQYAPMVKHIANRLAARLPSGFETDDLIQAGMIGLLESVEKFDPKKGILFKTYAEIRVKGAMLDDLRKKDWIPRSVRENAVKLEKAYASLRAQNIDHPTDAQLAKELGLKTKELTDFLDKSRPIPMLSSDSFGPLGSEEDQMDIMETVSNPDEKTPFDQIVDEEVQDALVKALERLPEKERMVLSLYYNEDLNLKEIGLVLDITESRASQIRTKAIGMLRSYMHEIMQ